MNATEYKEHMKGQPERYAEVYRDCAKRKLATNARMTKKTIETKAKKNDVLSSSNTSHLLIPQAH